MSRQPWGKAAIAGALLIVAIIATTWGLIEAAPLSCSLLGMTGKQSTVLLVSVSILGWLLSMAMVAFPALQVRWQRNLDRRFLTEDRVIQEIIAGKRLRVFASGSQTAQRALHPHISTITHQLKIEILVRSDGSTARNQTLAAEVSRWRRDIGRANVSLDIRAYSFEPVMIRGWIIDDETSITGWYFRHGGVTTGQSDPVFRVTDKEFVSSLCDIFDKMFTAGQVL